MLDLNCHNSAYNRILDWASYWNKEKVLFNESHNHTFQKRDVALKHLSKLNNMDAMTSKQNDVLFTNSCSDSSSAVKVTTFDFQQHVLSLLRDKELMHPDNLVLDYPFDSKPTFPKTKISDINNSDWYECAYKHYNHKFGEDNQRVICGIILTFDKTHTDAKGKLCLESVNFTLSIFNTKTRRSNPRAWRSLGFINDLSRQIPTKLALP